MAIIHRSFRGASAASEPGIQTHAPNTLLDSGFAPSARPGMTKVFSPLPNGEREQA